MWLLRLIRYAIFFVSQKCNGICAEKLSAIVSLLVFWSVFVFYARNRKVIIDWYGWYAIENIGEYVLVLVVVLWFIDFAVC